MQPDILQRRGAGQSVKITQAFYNGAVNAAQFVRENQPISTATRSDLEPWSTAVEMKNGHSVPVRRGDCLAANKALITANDQAVLNAGPTFEGQLPQFNASTNDWGKAGVYFNSCGNNRIESSHVDGVMVAYVVINHLSHDHCDIQNSSSVLSSHWSGSWRLLSIPSGAVAGQTYLCVIQHRGAWQRVMKATSVGTIPTGGSGSVNVYENLVDTGDNVTAHYNWLIGPPINGDEELFIKWMWDERQWVVVGRNPVAVEAIYSEGRRTFDPATPWDDGAIPFTSATTKNMTQIGTTAFRADVAGIYHMSCTVTICGWHDPQPATGSTASGRNLLKLFINGGLSDAAHLTEVDVIEYPDDRGRCDNNVSVTKFLALNDQVSFVVETPNKNAGHGDNGVIIAHCEITFEGLT